MKKETDESLGADIDLEIPRGGWRNSLRNLRTFGSLKNPVYRLYYGALLSQMAAMNMQMIARSLLIYRITGSAAILGSMAVANAVRCSFCRSLVE